jgi:hypothetical protein
MTHHTILTVTYECDSFFKREPASVETYLFSSHALAEQYASHLQRLYLQSYLAHSPAAISEVLAGVYLFYDAATGQLSKEIPDSCLKIWMDEVTKGSTVERVASWKIMAIASDPKF